MDNSGMRLSVFCAERGYGPREVAQALGVSERTAYRLMKGERRPKPKVMPVLRSWSGGLVTADDFYPDPNQSDAASDSHDGEHRSDEVASHSNQGEVI